jgi:ketosteroid isomerase-like protein
MSATYIALYSNKGNLSGRILIMSTQTAVSTTEAVLAHHLKAIGEQNLDDLVSDYSADAVVFAPNGVFKGEEQVRGFFGEALKMLSPEVLATLKVDRQAIEGEFAFLYWSAAPTIVMAQDTFCIHDGKIVMQSFAAHFGS